MKTRILFLAVAQIACMVSCSDNETTEPLQEVITEPIPVNIQLGMLYAVSHDYNKDECTFKIFFGDNPNEELMERFDGKHISLSILNKSGESVYSASPYKETYKTYHVGDSFTIPCIKCEQCTQIMVTVSESSSPNVIESWFQDYQSVHNFYHLKDK